MLAVVLIYRAILFWPSYCHRVTLWVEVNLEACRVAGSWTVNLESVGSRRDLFPQAYVAVAAGTLWMVASSP